MDLQGRSILLTGGGSGIGRSLALELADRGVRLALVGRRLEPLEEVAGQVRSRGSKAVVVPADLTAAGAPAEVVARTVEAFGGLGLRLRLRYPSTCRLTTPSSFTTRTSWRCG